MNVLTARILPLLMLAAVLAGPAAGAEPASYPPSLEPEAVRAWLKANTDIAPQQIVAITPSAATAIVARSQAGPVSKAVLRAEALTPDAQIRTGLLSWEVPLSVDCARGLIQIGETIGYAGRTPDSAKMIVAPAQEVWKTPMRGTPLDAAARTICSSPTPAPSAPPRSIAQPAASSKPTPEPAAPRKLQAPSPAPPKSPKQAAPGGPPTRWVAQVVSSPTQSDVARKLAALDKRFGDALHGLSTHVETKQLGGKTVYRGIVSGFASRPALEAFCQTLSRHGAPCLVRAP